VVLREMLTGERPHPDGASAAFADAPSLPPSQAHRGLDDRHDAVIARMTAQDSSSRPADAFEAIALLRALPWPATVDPMGAGTIAERKPSSPLEGTRLQTGPDESLVDIWTERTIERVPLSDRTLARARLFAIAGHPTLQLVLRVDREAGMIWLAGARGRPVDRPLRHGERADLEAAIAALHAAGGVHGHIDTAHVVVDDEAGATLLFDAEDAATNADGDWQALARLDMG